MSAMIDNNNIENEQFTKYYLPFGFHKRCETLEGGGRKMFVQGRLPSWSRRIGARCIIQIGHECSCFLRILRWFHRNLWWFFLLLFVLSGNVCAIVLFTGCRGSVSLGLEKRSDHRESTFSTKIKITRRRNDRWTKEWCSKSISPISYCKKVQINSKEKVNNRYCRPKDARDCSADQFAPLLSQKTQCSFLARKLMCIWGNSWLHESWIPEMRRSEFSVESGTNSTERGGFSDFLACFLNFQFQIIQSRRRAFRHIPWRYCWR